MEDGEPESPDALPTTHVVVDFEEVNGVDATAARSCFLQLAHILREHGIVLLLTAVRPRIQHLLRAPGQQGNGSPAFTLRLIPFLQLLPRRQRGRQEFHHRTHRLRQDSSRKRPGKLRHSCHGPETVRIRKGQRNQAPTHFFPKRTGTFIFSQGSERADEIPVLYS